MTRSSFVAASVIRFSIATLWVLAPPVLVALAIRDWRQDSRDDSKRAGIAIAVAITVLIDWAAFILFFRWGYIGGFGTHFITNRLASWFLVASLPLLLLALLTKIARGKLALASFLVLGLWAGSEMVR